MKNFMAMFLFFAFSLCFPQTVFFPGPQIKLTQAPFWLDMKDLQLIELGMKKDEINKIVSLITDSMMGAANLDVPLEIDIGIGDNWDQAH